MIMLHVFYGNDIVRVRLQALAFVDEVKAEAEVMPIEADGYAPGLLQEIAGGQSLFGDQRLFILDNWSDNAEAYEALGQELEQLAASNQHFVVIEGALLAAEKKKFEKWADSMEENKKAADRGFNSFALADALAKRDKKTLWLLWNEAILAGKSAEELSGILWWQLKTMRLAALGKSADEVGLKEYPFTKAKRSLTKFKPGELEEMSRGLLRVVNESRLGGLDTTLAMERWILKL